MLSFYLATEKTGGLFDIDATLPLFTLQFFILVGSLNLILFKPLQTTLQSRIILVEEDLRKATRLLEKIVFNENKFKIISKTIIKKTEIDISKITNQLENIIVDWKEKTYENEKSNFLKKIIKNYIFSQIKKNKIWSEKYSTLLVNFLELLFY